MYKGLIKCVFAIKIACFSIVLCFISPSVLLAQDWQMLIDDAENGLQGELAVDFARRITTATNGRLNIEVTTQDTLFKDDQVFGAVKNNLVPIGSRLISALAHESRLFQLDALPFLARNYIEAFKLYKASKVDLENILRIKGVKLLFAVPWPSQGFYSRVEINTLADLQDLKFRPYSQITSQFGQRLGMKQVIMPREKFTRQLTRNRRNLGVDVVFGSPLAAQNYPLAKVFPYWYDLSAWLPKEMTIVNLSVWEKLSEEEKALVTKIAMKVEAEGWAKSKQLQVDTQQSLVDLGIKVTSPSPALDEAIGVAASSVLQSWLGDVGDVGRHIWERYIQL